MNIIISPQSTSEDVFDTFQPAAFLTSLKSISLRHKKPLLPPGHTSLPVPARFLLSFHVLFLQPAPHRAHGDFSGFASPFSPLFHDIQSGMPEPPGLEQSGLCSPGFRTCFHFLGPALSSWRLQPRPGCSVFPGTGKGHCWCSSLRMLRAGRKQSH